MFQKNIRFFGFLIAFALMANMGYAQGTAGSSGKDASAKKTSSAGAEKKTKKADLVDINAAGKAELTALPGIGDAYSQKIIDGRPYNTKRDLLTRKILPQATYDQVKDSIIAHHVAGAAGDKKTKKGAATPK
ncbi:MAG TPA: helix-hairpin-helix domain-containing protein [Candidatus Angelobacter sp.]|jgi:DNA uptake protein ComE-like DNA-binding protein|nr:helix-hairpin-helix domain-containing protein [Candidatus Angelobacter sp.]